MSLRNHSAGLRFDLRLKSPNVTRELTASASKATVLWLNSRVPFPLEATPGKWQLLIFLDFQHPGKAQTCARFPTRLNNVLLNLKILKCDSKKMLGKQTLEYLWAYGRLLSACSRRLIKYWIIITNCLFDFIRLSSFPHFIWSHVVLWRKAFSYEGCVKVNINT